MPTLFDRTISSTYNRLIRVPESEGPLPPSDKLFNVEDGDGNIYNVGGGAYSQDVGNGSSTAFTIPHNLDTRELVVSVYRNTAPYDEVEVEVRHADLNNVVLDFGTTVPSANEYRVFVAGSATSTFVATSTLVQKGDIYVRSTFDTRLPVGTDGQIITADSLEVTGLKWIDPPENSPLTTKGDIFVHDGTNNERLPIGTDGQIIVADSAEATGLRWTALLGGEDYVDINADGAFPVASSQDSIVIGEAGTTDTFSPRSVGIGHTTLNTYGIDSIAIGTNAAASGQSLVPGANQIAIGTNARAEGSNGIAFGSSANAEADNAISIGGGSEALVGVNAIAIGSQARASGISCVSLGANSYARTNNSIAIRGQVHANAVSSVAIGNFARTGSYYNDDGEYAVAIGDTAYAYGTESISIGHFSRTENNFAIAIGQSAVAEGEDDIAIGRFASATGVDSVSIGDNSGASGSDSVALGSGASADNTRAVQISTGTNNDIDTLQFLTNRLANAEGLYTSFTAPSNYTPADTDNITSHLTAIDGALGGVTTGTPHLYDQTRRETLTANLNLTNADKGVLNIEVNNASFDTINLPGTPDTDRKFLIKNRTSSTFDLVITGQATLSPGELWKAYYDGTEWMEV